MSALVEILEIISPVFLIVGIGFLLGRLNFLSEESVSRMSKLVFYVCGPALLFRSAALTPLARAIDPAALLLAAFVSTAAAAAVYFGAAARAPSRRGVLAQGVFRSNLVFVALPVIANAYGDEMLGPAAVFIGFMVPVYNFLAVTVLTLPHGRGGRGRAGVWLGALRSIALNPLIIGSAGGIAFSALRLPLPFFADRTLGLLAGIAMPLALLTVGAGLEFSILKQELSSAALVAFVKLIACPAAMFAGLCLLGRSGVDLYFPVLLLAAPTAVVSHIMALEMRGDGRLAGAIVIGTTLGSLFTYTGWLLLFRVMG